MKYPYIKFYTGDWLKDPQLSMCSPAARGVWMDLICAIHEQGFSSKPDSKPTSKLIANIKQIARVTRCNETEVLSALRELQDTHTATITKEGELFTISCRRIEKQLELIANRQQSGSKGGAKAQANRQQNPVMTSDSDSTALEKVREFARGEGIGEQDADWFFWKGQGNGWTNGGKPMLDWKATLRSWNRARYLPSQKQSQPNNSQRSMSAFEIEKRLDAVRGAMDALHRKQPKNVEDKTVWKEADIPERDRLKTLRDELKAKLVQ